MSVQQVNSPASCFNRHHMKVDSMERQGNDVVIEDPRRVIFLRGREFVRETDDRRLSAGGKGK